MPLKLTAIAALADLPGQPLRARREAGRCPPTTSSSPSTRRRSTGSTAARTTPRMVGAAANEAGGNAFIAEYAGTARVMDAAVWPNALNQRPGVAGRHDAPSVPAAGALPEPADSTADAAAAPVHPRAADPDRHGDQRILSSTTATRRTGRSMILRSRRSIRSSRPPRSRKIIDPLQTAQKLFDYHAYLTRLATFISPAEMTTYPEFVFNSRSPRCCPTFTPPPRTSCAGRRSYTYCEAPIRLELPGGGGSIWYQRQPVLRLRRQQLQQHAVARGRLPAAPRPARGRPRLTTG